MTILKNAEDLLFHAAAINEKASQQKQVNPSRNFNIFTLLDREADEVKCHSKFLSELLSPKGTHGLGSQFLDLFLKEFNEIAPFNVSSQKATVELEKSAPWENHGGRIDIRIETEDSILLVENKIYAEDQYKQLERYYLYTKKFNPKNKNIILVYLTLEGDDPTDTSIGEAPKELLVNISYKEFIRDFLERCISSCGDHPVIQQTIVQYSNLIKKLTGDVIEMTTATEVLKLIDSQDKLQAALLIAKATEEARIEIEKKFWDELSVKMTAKLQDHKDIHVNYQCGPSYSKEKIAKSSNYYGLYIKLGQIDGYTVVFALNKENGILYQGLRFLNANNEIPGDFKHEALTKTCYQKIEKFFTEPHTNRWFIVWNKPQTAKDLRFKDFYDNEFVKLIEPAFRNDYLENLANEMTGLILSSRQALF